MSERTDVNVAGNLHDLIQGDQQGYELRVGFSLELTHGLMGYFPAIYKDSEEVVITVDEELIVDVCRTLTPRRCRLNRHVFYVNKKTGVGYNALAESVEDLLKRKPKTFLTREKFEELIRADEHPFEWTPGLVGNDMTPEEFRQTLVAAAREHGIELAP